MLGFFGPAAEEVQSIEEQDIWYGKLYGVVLPLIFLGYNFTFEMHLFHR